MTVRAVVFDVGETLIDETRIWSAWADLLGVPRLTFFGVLGAVIARGGDHREPFALFRPDLDLQAEMRRHAESREGAADAARDDLYPDAEPALAALAGAGYRLGIVGNQPARAEALFRELNVPLEFVASSATCGVEKPDPRFFERIADELRLPAGRSPTSAIASTTTSGRRRGRACSRSSSGAGRGRGSRRVAGSRPTRP